jgi:dTDP-4-amino-4,6-dideoxygalactose transaminase
MASIPFNRPQLVGGEHAHIDAALASGQLSGNGVFGRRCADWLADHVGAPRALVVPSCTAALEMTALITDLQAGDEVIMPSFTFVSTANAFALRGVTPVFVDIEPATLNVSPAAISAAVTDRTRAIVVVHYAGVSCDMDAIGQIAREHDLVLIEDAAHALPASYRGRPLGSIGALSTFSFHETKNVQCGEGGALIINDPALVTAAEIIQEKGTDRSQFFRGQVDKYTWQTAGSSYLLSEVAAAFLLAQLESIDVITARRREIWHRYHEGLADCERDGLLTRPTVPEGCVHSGHLYYVLAPTAEARTAMLQSLRAEDVNAVFHYVPLHDSPGGRRYGRVHGSMDVTNDASQRLIRLPLWPGLPDADVDRVIEVTRAAAAEVSHARSA